MQNILGFIKFTIRYVLFNILLLVRKPVRGLGRFIGMTLLFFPYFIETYGHHRPHDLTFWMMIIPAHLGGFLLVGLTAYYDKVLLSLSPYDITLLDS